jgi:hypothetical protein
MGIRRSTVKNKKSMRATAAIRVKRDAVIRGAARLKTAR